MFIVRPVAGGDLEGLLKLARKAGTGLTTLPAHEPTLANRIEESLAAFGRLETGLQKRTYLLVMEEGASGRIVGTSAIVAGVGLDKPFYSYRLLHQTQVSHNPEMRVDTSLLNLSNDFVGACEMATLFLDPDYRQGRLGRLMSKARYMLLGAHPQRFSDQVIAEIRGWVDDNDNSPFWESIGRHFFGMDFKTADRINGEGNSQFIADLMPKFPIYTALLPKTAQDVIGRPHDGARPAIRLLEQEGFRFSGAVDIFDGGPAMEVHRRGIWTVRASREDILAGLVDAPERPADHLAADHLAANPSLDHFRVVLTRVVETHSGLWLPRDAGAALGIGAGDRIRYAPVERKKDARTKEQGAGGPQALPPGKDATADKGEG